MTIIIRNKFKFSNKIPYKDILFYQQIPTTHITEKKFKQSLQTLLKLLGT